MSSQHLEEADELADRIAIMTKGKILKVDGFSGIGVPEQIKERFGVGYKVIIQ